MTIKWHRLLCSDRPIQQDTCPYHAAAHSTGAKACVVVPLLNTKRPSILLCTVSNVLYFYTTAVM